MAGPGMGSSPWAVSTQETGRGVLAAMHTSPLWVPRAGVRLRGWTGSGAGLGAAGRKGGASGRPLFRDVAGAWDCPRPLRWQLTGSWVGPRAGALEAAGAVGAFTATVEVGTKAKACRTGVPLSSAEAQEPEVRLGPAAVGALGLESVDSETAGPVAGGVGEASGRAGWRTTGEETSSWRGRTTGPWAALLARASRSRFSRSSSDTVLGLGRGPHDGGGGACGVRSARQACGPRLPLQRALFAASRAGTFCRRQPEEEQDTHRGPGGCPRHEPPPARRWEAVLLGAHWEPSTQAERDPPVWLHIPPPPPRAHSSTRPSPLPALTSPAARP